MTLVEVHTASRAQVVAMTHSQAGCRHLQAAIDAEPSLASHLLSIALLDEMERIADDPFGNYLTQKLAENVSPAERTRMIDAIAARAGAIARGPHGTRAIQRLLELVDSDEEAAALDGALREHVVDLSMDVCGNHVIQRALASMRGAADRQFVFDGVTDPRYLVIIAAHRHGCTILQRAVDAADDEQLLQLEQAVVRFGQELALDRHGNYVLQRLLARGGARTANALAKALGGRLLHLSLDKCSSNVIEQVLRTCSRQACAGLVDELVAAKSNGLLTLAKNSYGNYVVQTALQCAPEPQLSELNRVLAPIMADMKSGPYGKRLVRLMKTPP